MATKHSSAILRLWSFLSSGDLIKRSLKPLNYFRCFSGGIKIDPDESTVVLVENTELCNGWI